MNNLDALAIFAYGRTLLGMMALNPDGSTVGAARGVEGSTTPDPPGGEFEFLTTRAANECPDCFKGYNGVCERCLEEDESPS